MVWLSSTLFREGAMLTGPFQNLAMVVHPYSASTGEVEEGRLGIQGHHQWVWDQSGVFQDLKAKQNWNNKKKWSPFYCVVFLLAPTPLVLKNVLSTVSILETQTGMRKMANK